MNPQDPDSKTPRWDELVARLRKLPHDESPENAPLGFATKVVAQADLKPKSALMVRIRNWSLALAGSSACLLLITTSLHEPKEQFLPLPEPEFPTPAYP